MSQQIRWSADGESLLIVRDHALQWLTAAGEELGRLMLPGPGIARLTPRHLVVGASGSLILRWRLPGQDG